MNKESIRDLGSLMKLIIEAVEAGRCYFRPGDLRSAKEIIGTKLWTPEFDS